MDKLKKFYSNLQNSAHNTIKSQNKDFTILENSLIESDKKEEIFVQLEKIIGH